MPVLAGSVKDDTGKPLSSVTVTVTGGSTAVTQTGPDGSFTFDMLPAGEYRLVATLAGFATVTRSVRLTEGQTATLSLTMSVSIVERSIVTATKSGETDVQTMPAAVSVLPAREIEREQARDVEDLARLAPAVTFSQNTGFAQLYIRGIGTNAVFAGSDPSSAVYIDGVYVARPAMVLADLLDVERVEVLRGPQGTLYGRNAVGGALNVITKGPTNDFGVSARFIAGNQETLRGEASVSGPLVPGRVLGSVAALVGTARGFVRDLNHADHFPGSEDVSAVTGKARVIVNRSTELLLSGDYTHQSGTPMSYAKVLAVKPGFQVDNPPDIHEVRTNTVGTSTNRQGGAAIRFTMHLTPTTTLTSLTAFRSLDYELTVDADITEMDLTVSNVHEIHDQWSEELTFSQRTPKLSWLGGMFLFGEDDWQPTRVELGGPRLENHLRPRVESSSKALFGETTIAVTRRLSATAGMRYTRESKTIDNQGELVTLEAPVTVVPGSAYGYTDAMSHDAWTPRLALTLRVKPRTLTYVSATRGFKSGGFNFTSPERGRGFAPEWAWSYEAGLKTLFSGSRTRLNIAAFYTDYTNLQVQTAIRPGVIDISNAAAATLKGLEMESVTHFGPWRAGGYVNWLDTRYDRYIAVGVSGVTGDVAGRRLNNAPVWSGRAWVEWIRDVGRAGTLSIRPEALWKSTAYFTPFNDAIQRQSPYGLLNVSAEIRPPRLCCAFAVSARNLTNQGYITGTFSSPPPAIGGRPGPSRQIAVELTLRR